MFNQSTNFWRGVIFLILAALAWSTAGLFPRLISTDVFTTLFWRSLLGGITVLLIKILFSKKLLSNGLFKLSRAEVILSSLTGIAMLCFTSAFFYTSVADVVFIYGTFPIVTLILSSLILKIRLRGLDLMCAIAVTIGLATILWGQATLKNSFGALLSFISTLMFALITVVIKHYPQADMIKATYIGAFISALAISPFVNFTHTNLHDITWLWLYGIINIGAGFGFFMLGVRDIKPVLSSLVCMIEIPLAPLWTYFLLGEKISEQSLLGGCIILIAVLVNLVWIS